MILTKSTPATDYMNSDGDFILNVPTDRTITVTDPDGQLFDTNYDGHYDGGARKRTKTPRHNFFRQ
jgi:hypothetical protein